MVKRLFMTVIIGMAGFAAWQAAHPAPVSADTPVGEVQADNTESFMGRVKHRIGLITVGVAGGQIRGSVANIERDRALLEPAMKKTGGLSGTNAKIMSLKVIALDSLSLASLDAAHPIDAMKQAFDARRFIDLIRQDVSDETAAR